MFRLAVLISALVAAPALAQIVADPIPQPWTPPPQTIQPSDDMTLARNAAARGDPAEALSRYLRVLAGHPDDVAALTGAGEAAFAVGDLTAASGFFGRAEARAPNDGAIKAGIGAMLVRQGDARGALRYFRAAAQLGVPEARYAADRGLAYDLRGEPRRAQADYQLALSQRPGDAETVKRYALSQALAGEQAAALATLDPLLRRQDLSAWRTRMFVRAVSGDVAGATADAGLILNASQAAAIAPYLQQLATLRPAEKAAAVFLGRMPSAHPAAVAIASAPSPARMPAPPPAATAYSLPAPPPQVATMPLPPPGGSAASAPVDLGQRAQSVPESVPASRPLSRRERLAEARRQAIEDEHQAAERFEARNPTRYWAQLAGGANKRDLPRAWAALRARWGSQLAGRSPTTMHYRYTNRLLIGPFASASAAQDWVNERRGQGLAAFMVTTPAGTAVESLDGSEVGPSTPAHEKAGRRGKASRYARTYGGHATSKSGGRTSGHRRHH